MAEQPQEVEEELDLLRLSDAENEPIDWLIDQYIAKGYTTNIFGDPAEGKTTMIICMAARLTRGKPWPFDSSAAPAACSVIIMATEDGGLDTIRPRLDAAGADLSKVHLVRGINARKQTAALGGRVKTKPAGTRAFNLEKDLPKLRASIKKIGDVGLVIIDPITGYMPTINTVKDNEVRSLLMEVKQLAEECNVAIITIMHMNKDNSKTVLQRPSGSVAFAAVPRMAFIAVRHPVKFDTTKERLFLPAKANNADPDVCKGISYQIGTKYVDSPKGRIKAIRVEVLGPTDMPAMVALSDKPRKERSDSGTGADRIAALTFINDQLKGGLIMKVKEFNIAAGASGFSAATLRRARLDAGVIVEKDKEFQGGFTIRLPDMLNGNGAAPPKKSKFAK